MSRAIALVTVVALVAPVFAGCGASKKSSSAGGTGSPVPSSGSGTNFKIEKDSSGAIKRTCDRPSMGRQPPARTRSRPMSSVTSAGLFHSPGQVAVCHGQR